MLADPQSQRRHRHTAVHECSAALARFDAELVAQEPRVGAEGAQRLDLVALRQVRLDQRLLGALPQRLAADRVHRGLDGVARSGRSPPAPAHAPPARGATAAGSVRARRSPSRRTSPAGCRQPPGPRSRLRRSAGVALPSTTRAAQSHNAWTSVTAVAAQREDELVGLEHVDAGALEPPQRRAQVARGALVGAVRPERSGRLPAIHATAVQRDKGQQPLAALRDAAAPPAAQHVGTAEQAQGLPLGRLLGRGLGCGTTQRTRRRFLTARGRCRTLAARLSPLRHEYVTGHATPS